MKPDRRLVLIAATGLVGALLVCPGLARATVGDDSPIEPIGYDPAERTIFALGLSVEQVLLVAHLDRPGGPRFVTARRWRGLDHEVFEERLAALRRRLVPLTRLGPSDFAVAIDRGPVVRRYCEWIETNVPWRDARVEVRAGALSGSDRLSYMAGRFGPSSGGARLRLGGVFRVPGEDLGLAIVSAFDQDWELGYFTDHAIWLRPTP